MGGTLERPAEPAPSRYLWSALCRLNGVPTALRATLWRDPEAIRSLRSGLLPPDLAPTLARALKRLDWETCRKEDEKAEKEGVSIVPFGDPEYPPSLASLPDPPPALYARGSLAALRLPAVALVGSRLSTVYGQNVARMLGEDLARAGVAVVSGLARGIDAAAHEGALQGGGRCIAVLATGIDTVYPREHEGLARRIADSGGLILAESPPGTPPIPRLFPTRNRIIAGLSWGVVVVEAAERSGSLITARLALERGRELFAVPHNITSRTGVGPNTLLQGGAGMVQRAADILDEMPAYQREALVTPKPQAASPPDASSLSPGALALLEALEPDEGRGLDALAQATSLPVPSLLIHLLELQMARLCVELPGARYARLPAGRRDSRRSSQKTLE